VFNYLTYKQYSRTAS